MKNPIPWRLFYPVEETAQLVGCSREHVYELIRRGEREQPPADAILPSIVRRNGARLTIHRSWLFPNEPANLSPFPVNQLSEVDIERIAKRTSELVLESMYLAFRRSG